MGRRTGRDNAALPGPRQVSQPPVPPQGLSGEGGGNQPTRTGRADAGYLRLRRRCGIHRPGASLRLRPRCLRPTLALPLPQPHLHTARTDPPGRLAGPAPGE